MSLSTEKKAAIVAAFDVRNNLSVVADFVQKFTVAHVAAWAIK